MKLLLFTQIVDSNDTNLGFFHAWIKKISEQVDELTVVCLQKGEYSLPKNVKVISLGKEAGIGRLGYLKNFYKTIFKERKNYDHVFVHMNPEYVVLGGLFWRLRGKKILLWYTHKSVDFKLRLAEMLATKIFSVNEASFRLPSRKVEFVGHGIDVADYRLQPAPTSTSGTTDYGLRTDTVKLLFVGRISPVKDLETIVLALKKLGDNFYLDIVGETITDTDKEYEETVRDLVVKTRLSHRVQFMGGVSYSKLPEIYFKHHALVHTSRTGSVDKVVLEALASGLPVFSSSEAYTDFGDAVIYFEANDNKGLAEGIEKLFSSGIVGGNVSGREMVERGHSLEVLIGRIVNYFLCKRFLS